MTDTEPRLTVDTPEGNFPIGDPRAVEAIAAYVRSAIPDNIDPHQIAQINAALVLHPQDGVCLNCARRLPLFLYRCEHWEVFGFSHAHRMWLCTRCTSRAVELFDEHDKNICNEVAWEPYDGWEPFTGPRPGTAEFKAASRAAVAASQRPMVVAK